MTGSKGWRWLWLSAFVILLDQVTKSLVNHLMRVGETQNIWSGVDLTLVHNAGAAFGIMSQAGGWQVPFLAMVSGTLSLGVLLWLGRVKSGDHLTAMSLAMILGGALSNLADRIFYGYVVDFIDLSVKSYHWPAFNVADSCITLGVVFMLYSLFRKST